MTIDLATADTTELRKVPGIGSGIARMIVAYREKLGGFYSVGQVTGIKYVTDDMLPWFRIDTIALRPILINRLGIERLRQHPYINFYQARAIVQFRRKHGNISHISQLRLLEEFSAADWERIEPYISYQ